MSWPEWFKPVKTTSDTYYFNYGEWHEFPIMKYGEEEIQRRLLVRELQVTFDKATGKLIMVRSPEVALQYVPEYIKETAIAWGREVLGQRYGWEKDDGTDDLRLP